MRVRKLGEDDDIETSGVIWAKDAEAVAQTVKTRLRLFLGEYFRDVLDGVPWFEKSDGTEGILGKGYALGAVESILRARIAETEGVVRLLRFGLSFDQNKRSLNVSATIQTDFGTVSIDYGTDH